MTDQNTNIQELKNQVSKFTQERNWKEFHNPKNLAMSIAIEDKIRKNGIKYLILFILPDNFKGRSLHEMVIPTVCNLENMLNKLIKVNGDFNQLKQWEKRSYKAYNIDEILDEILYAEPNAWKDIIKDYILDTDVFELGANCIDIDTLFLLYSYTKKWYNSLKTV